MLKGIDVNKRIEFVSKEDKSEPKTIFVFRPVSGYDAISGKEDENPTINSLMKSIVEIKNYDGNMSKSEILKSVPVSVMSELIDEMNRINVLSDDAKKKS